MLTGLSAGITWALETVVLAAALGMISSDSLPQAALLPLAATFLHDAFSALYMFAYNTVRGNLKKLPEVVRSSGFRWLVAASSVGGPVGMTGYVLAVGNMGAAAGAVASAVYPAIGTALACIFLKEKVKWYRWVFLAAALAGVFGLSYSPGSGVENIWLGLLGVAMCSLGWGTEAVILAKCFKSGEIGQSLALSIRQAVSALIYGAVILPVTGGWKLMAGLFGGGTGMFMPAVAAAAFFASVSYMLYYRTIASAGAAKAMALNITYTAWSIFFTCIITGKTDILSPFTVCCAAVVVIFGILAAADFRALFARKNK